MSHMNKPRVDQSFEIVRQCLKSSVPPCNAIADTPTHYETEAVNGNQKHVFGYVVAHEHVITIGFSTDIPEKDLKELIPARLLEKMNGHRRMEIRDVQVHELHSDLQEEIGRAHV